MTLFTLLNALQGVSLDDITVVVSDGFHQFQITNVTLEQSQATTKPDGVLVIVFDTNS